MLAMVRVKLQSSDLGGPIRPRPCLLPVYASEFSGLQRIQETGGRAAVCPGIVNHPQRSSGYPSRWSRLTAGRNTPVHLVRTDDLCGAVRGHTERGVRSVVYTVVESLCCAPATDVILYVSYTSVNETETVPTLSLRLPAQILTGSPGASGLSLAQDPERERRRGESVLPAKLSDWGELSRFPNTENSVSKHVCLSCS